MDSAELLNRISDEDVREQVQSLISSLEGSPLRKERDDALAQAKQWKGQVKVRAYKDAGLPESAFDVFDKVYEGDLEPESIRTFASTKGFALGDPSAPVPVDPAAQRAAGEQRLEQVVSGALPSRDPSLNDEIAQATQKGDWDTVDRLNARKLEAVRNS